MTTTVTNRGKTLIPSGDLLVTTYLMGLLGGGSDLPGAAHNQSLNNVADLLAIGGVAEVSGGGYSRQVITGIAVTEDDVNNRANITSNNVSFGNLTATAGTGRGMFILRTGGSDATRDLLMIADMAPKIFNGNPVTVNVTALFRLVQL